VAQLDLTSGSSSWLAILPVLMSQWIRLASSDSCALKSEMTALSSPDFLGFPGLLSGQDGPPDRDGGGCCRDNG
jgi:hypothetical protein